MSYPWRKGKKPVDLDYIIEELNKRDVAELHYNPGSSEITSAEQASLYLQENGFHVVEKEKDGMITLVVSKLEKEVV